MVAIKLQKFLGAAPRLSEEQLPDRVGEVAYNVNPFSGDLIPYPDIGLVTTVPQSVAIEGLYGLHDPTTDAISWLTWTTDVDVVIASDTSDDEQRFYFTGDGVPKVSTYDLATTGSEPYPVASYDLGLPLPTVTPTTSAASFAVSSSVSYARDSGNTATLVTGTHGLRTGNIITVRAFVTGAATDWNATNVFVTVVDSTTITYYNPGDTVTTVANTEGRIDLAGNTQVVTHLYTWITPWGEESIGSEPSAALFIKEGQTVTVSGLPTAAPAGDNLIMGMSLYRTITSASGATYFKLSDLWFPVEASTDAWTVSLASNVATIDFGAHHNLSVGDRFKTSGCADSTFDITGGTVVSVVDHETITYAKVAGDITSKSEATGTMFHDVAEVPTDSARYYGDTGGGGSDDFTDDFDVANLLFSLTSSNYDQPHEDMIGITSGPNGILFGFFDNQLCFSELSQPHAWPIDYRITLADDIVGVEAVHGYILVMTESYSYRVSGNDPATMIVARIDTLYPCLSKKSIVNMGYAVVYATYGGLASWSPADGIGLVTKLIHDWTTWEDTVDPTTVVGQYYNDKYFCSHSTGSFMFEKNEKIGGNYVTIPHIFDSAWLDPATNNLYTTSSVEEDDIGTITEWDSSDNPLRPLEWKSKSLVTPVYINLGAARIIADYDVTAEDAAAVVAANLTIAATNTTLWTESEQLGTLNGPTDYQVSSLDVNNRGEINSTIINGDNLMTPALSTGAYTVTFNLWVNKVLTFTAAITSDDIFRLPTGYKSDTFAVSVAGKARIRAIHLGETPHGLRNV